MNRGGTFEKRREKRSRRRLRVLFEVDGARSGGYTTNVSLRGMQVTGAVVFPMGTVVKGHIELPDGKQIPFDAKVRWAIKGAGTFATLHQKSMGLQLIGVPPRELFELLENFRDDEGTTGRDGAGRAPRTTSRDAAPPTAPPPAAARPPGSHGTSAPPRAPAPTSPATVTPEPRSAEPASIRGPQRPEVVWGGMPIGRKGTAQLTMPATGPLTLSTATEIVERAVRAAIDDLLSADQESRGVKVVLTIIDSEPVPAGSIMQAVARVEGSSDGGKLVDLAVDLSELGRPLGKATCTMLVMRRRR